MLVDLLTDLRGRQALAHAVLLGACLLAYEQQATAGISAAGRDHADLRRSRDLAVTGLAPHLRRALVQEAVAVQPAGGELTAVRVQRQAAVARDVLAAVDERTALADVAQ